MRLKSEWKIYELVDEDSDASEFSAINEQVLLSISEGGFSSREMALNYLSNRSQPLTNNHQYVILEVFRPVSKY